jgi:peroxiredoxin Q/BCP
LREEYSELRAKGIEVLAIGPDSPEKFEAYWRKEDLPFPGLADPGKRVLDRYAQEVSLLKLGRMPAVVAVDRQGIVRGVHYGSSMADIPSTDALVAGLGEEA